MTKTAAKKDNNTRTEVRSQDFIPYACHYDDHTLITKNGELMQVIKITGFSFESVKEDKTHILDLRSAIRKAVAESIKTNNFSIWFHTIRRKRSLAPGGDYLEGFARELNQAWDKKHDWENKFTNELYISILIEGEPLKPKDPKIFLRNLYFKQEFAQRTAFFENAAKNLETVANSLCEKLSGFGAKRLGIYKNEGIYYSEILGFLGKIINLKEVPVALDIKDISDTLSTHSLLFGFNVLEVNGETGRHFGTMITIKEYHEISTKQIDTFLQLPITFVITETFDFVNNKKALSYFEGQYRLQRLAGDADLMEASGLGDIIACDTGSPTDFGEHQITIMLLEDSIPKLEEEVQRTVSSFRELGVMVVREDIFMEDCYWAQLPGNFEFIKRMAPINTKRIGGYASLYNFPAGKLKGNYWGSALTVFYTAAGTTYFFNFHYHDNGHALIVGPFGAGKTALMNFLVSEAMKYRPKLFFFDQQRGGEIFIRALGGKYLKIDREKQYSKIKFNPLILDDTTENREFLGHLFAYLINAEENELPQRDKEKIAEAINYNFSLEKEQRTLSKVINNFWQLPSPPSKTQAPVEINYMEAEEEKPVAVKTTEEKLSEWCGDGLYAHYFDNQSDEFVIGENPIFGFDMTHIVQDKEPIVPVVFYLMHRIEQSLDGKPAIIVLDEAWSLIDNPAFSSHIGEWMDRLRAKNAIAIFATEHVEDAEKSPMTKILSEKIETKIFLPNKNADERSYEGVFGLSEEEYEMLTEIDSSRRQFLLKHNVDAVLAELSLDGMDFELAVLSSTYEKIAQMEGILSEFGEDPAVWLPIFKERIKS